MQNVAIGLDPYNGKPVIFCAAGVGKLKKEKQN